MPAIPLSRVRILIAAAALLAALATLSATTSAATLTISGLVWSDTNADGIRQPAEPGIASAVVRLTSATHGDLPPATADAAGRYQFTGLEPGQYTVLLGPTLGGQWAQTNPVRNLVHPEATVIALSDQSVDSADFGLFPMGGVPRLSGIAWRNAEQVANPVVRVFIGDVDCTLPPAILVTDKAASSYSLRIAPAQLIAGCGVDGAQVRFTLNGEAVNETFTWQRAAVEQFAPSLMPPSIPPPGAPGTPPLLAGAAVLDLTIGPPFAAYYGSVGADRLLTAAEYSLYNDLKVEARIDGRVCGSTANLNLPASYLVVPSEELAPGCGRAGATVQFFVNGEPVIDEDGDRTTQDVTTWKPGAQVMRLVVRSDAPPSASMPPAAASEAVVPRITPPGTGDGGLR